MKKLKNNKNLKIISATAVAIFSLLSVFMGTIAWFSASRVVSGNGGQVTLLTPTGIFKKLTFHRLLSDPYEDSTYCFDQTPLGTITVNSWVDKTTTYTPNGVNNISLDKFTILEHRHPILMLIELEEAYDVNTMTVNVTGITETIGFVGDRSSGLELQINGNPLSSIVHFAAFGYTDAALQATKTTFTANATTSNVYSFAKPAENQFNSFVDFEVEGEDDETIEINFKNDFKMYDGVRDTTKNIKTNNETEFKVKYIPILMDYYDTALEYIYSAYLGDDILENDLVYNWDWEMKV